MIEGAPLGALVRLFLCLGFSGFGGSLVHIALMETEVVERRKGLSKEQFLDGLSLCQMLPGPASTQLGVLICYLQGVNAAVVGAIAAATIPRPGGAIVSPFTALVAAASLVALGRFRVDSVWLVLVSGAAGWLSSRLG